MCRKTPSLRRGAQPQKRLSMIKKIAKFLLLFLVLMGAIGGIIETVINGSYLITAGLVALSVFACPKFLEEVNNLLNGDD